jgi:hypothetical protein
MSSPPAFEVIGCRGFALGMRSRRLTREQVVV